MNKCETRNCNRITGDVYCDQCFSETEAYQKGISQGELNTLRLLESEFSALKDMGDSKEYVEGFEHAILLLQDRMGLIDN